MTNTLYQALINWIDDIKFILMKVSEIVSTHAAEFAYPTSTPHMPELAQVAANAAYSG